VPTSQFTHFVHELASSTSQSLLGAVPPNPCLRTSTNVLHTNVYLIILFFKVHLRFCYLSALKWAQHLQICLTIDSVILKTICLLLLQVSSNSVQRTLSFIVDPSPNFSTGIHTAQPQNSHCSPIHIPTYTLFYQGHCKLTLFSI